MGARDPDSGLMLMWQAPEQLSHLLSPRIHFLFYSQGKYVVKVLYFLTCGIRHINKACFVNRHNCLNSHLIVGKQLPPVCFRLLKVVSVLEIDSVEFCISTEVSSAVYSKCVVLIIRKGFSGRIFYTCMG